MTKPPRAAIPRLESSRNNSSASNSHINDNKNKTQEIRQDQQMFRENDNLDGQGQSCLLYPGQDGKYTIPIDKEQHSGFNEFIKGINNAFSHVEAASSDTKELEDLIQTFNNSQNNRNDTHKDIPNVGVVTPVATSPRDALQNSQNIALMNPKNWTQYSIKPNAYASNIANIVKSTNSVSSPFMDSRKDANPLGVDHMTTTGFKMNPNNFPHDVFRINPKIKKPT